MRISDWSSDVCSSDLIHLHLRCDSLDIVGGEQLEKTVHDLAPGPEIVRTLRPATFREPGHGALEAVRLDIGHARQQRADRTRRIETFVRNLADQPCRVQPDKAIPDPSFRGKNSQVGERSEAQTYELQTLMRTSYAI